MRTYSTKSKIVVAAVTAGTLGVSGVAYAYWTTSGSGAGAATTAAANGTLALHADTVPSTITPGGTYTVAIQADNSGTTDLRVNSVSTVISSGKPSCQTLIDAGTSGLSFAAVNTSANTVAAGLKDITIGTGSLVWSNSSTVDQSACKSAGIVLTFTGS